MHPRFLEFINELRERPLKHRQMIGFVFAATLTIVLVTGKIIVFPTHLSLEGGSADSRVAGFSDAWSGAKQAFGEEVGALADQIDRIRVEGAELSGEGGASHSTEPAVIPLTGDSSEPKPVPDDWAVSEDGSYYYRYPTSVGSR